MVPWTTAPHEEADVRAILYPSTLWYTRGPVGPLFQPLLEETERLYKTIKITIGQGKKVCNVTPPLLIHISIFDEVRLPPPTPGETAANGKYNIKGQRDKMYVWLNSGI